MYPILFKIGPFTLYSYGLFLSLGFLTAVWLAKRNIREKKNFAPEKIIDLGLVVLLAAIVGARLTYVLLNINQYLIAPLEIIKIHHGGMVFYGGLVAGLLAGWFLIRHWGLNFFEVGDTVLPYVALAQSIGRIGCLLNGCCYGRPTNLIIGICLPHHNQSLHPTQIYSSLVLLAIFIILRVLSDKSRRSGLVTLVYFLIYPIARFILEFFRGDVPRFFWGLTFSQIFSFLIFLAATVLLFKHIREG